MVLDAEKRNKLVELVACRKAALADAGTSTPAGPHLVATSAPISPEPAPIDHRQKRVVEATASENEDTCTCLVFKRKRVDDVVAPSLSTLDGHTLSFRENPLNASSPRELIVLEGGGKSALVGDHAMPFADDLPSFLQEVLQGFQGREVDSQGEDSLGGPVARGLGAFLVESSRASTQAQ